jgi:nucleoside-diphosphate-sugar epimerase
MEGTNPVVDGTKENFEIIPYDQLRVEGKRVMLVGGAGFIGHHLALKLREIGAEVMIVDHLQINNLVKVVNDRELDETRRKLYTNFLLDRYALLRNADIAVESVDARQMAELTMTFDQFEPTHIVHLAAISSAVTANQVPGLAYDLQISSLRNVLELCRLKGSKVERVSFMSSSTVYGDFEGDSVDETVRPSPRGVYANGKYIGERMMREAWNLFGTSYSIIRPSALYGIRCVSGRVSQKFVENALTGKPLLLEGGGSGRLDFTHIDDVVQGIILGLFLDGGRSRTFNITFGNARTIADLAGIIQEYIPEVILEERPAAKEKPKRGTLMVDRAKEYLGFEPNFPLDRGYRSYVEWYVSEWKRISIT